MVSNTPWSVQPTRTAVSIINRRGEVVMCFRPVMHGEIRTGYQSVEELITMATMLCRQVNEQNGALVTVNPSAVEEKPAVQKIPNYDNTYRYIGDEIN